MWTKCGLHAERNTAEVQRWARVAPVIKAVGDVSILRDAKAANPGIFTIFRFYVEQNEQDNWSPQDFATATLAALAGFRPDCVEYKNEWRQYQSEDLQRHIDELRIYTEIMHGRGLAVCGYSLSVGSSEREDVQLMRRYGFSGADYLSLHAYWQKYKPQDPWTAEWYRDVHDWSGGDHPPMILSEWGIDDIDGMGAGWRAQGIPSHEYIQQLTTNEARLPDYVHYATVFGAGPWPRWEQFSTDVIVDEIIAEATRGGVYVPPVVPPTEGGGNVDKLEAALRDMWKRQGVDPADSDGFWQYALAQARQGKLLYPQYSKDGNWQNHDDPKYARALTIPPMWAEKGVWQVKEGFPPF